MNRVETIVAIGSSSRRDRTARSLDTMTPHATHIRTGNSAAAARVFRAFWTIRSSRRNPGDSSRRTKEHFMSDDQPTDVVAALSDGAYTLFVADFTDTDTAWAAYETLKSVEDGKTLDIEGVIVVKRDA